MTDDGAMAGSSETPGRTRPRVRLTRQAAPALVVLVAASAAVAGIGAGVYRWQEEAVRDQRHLELEILGETNAGQIGAWIDERLADVEVAAGSPFLASAVERWLATGDPETRGRIESHLDRVADTYRYEVILLLAPDGRHLLSTGTDHPLLLATTRELTQRVILSGRPAMVDSVVDDPEPHVHIDFAAAMLDATGRPAAVLVLRSDPEVTLYPRLLGWLTRDDTAEVLLVRLRADRVVFLNTPRLAGDPPPRSIPLTRREVPTVQAALGLVGRTRGIDYRGVPVLADVRGIPGTQWFMATKVDEAEVMSEARYRGSITLLLVVLVTLLLGGSLSLVVMRVERHRRRQVGSLEAERETLRRHYERIISLARDIFILADVDGRILEANRAAEAAYGHSREELLGMTVRDLRAPETRETLEREVAATQRPGGATFQTVHQRRDGSRFPVEIASRYVSLEGRTYRQSVVRDISDRVSTEERLREQLDELQRWHSAALGREERISELKAEVNDLLGAEGRPPRYSSTGDAPEGADA